jgi:hypothetical protein
MVKKARLTGVDTGLSDVTNGSSLHNISDDKFLDSLVLRHTTSAICTTDSLHMATVVLATSSVTAFLSLEIEEKEKVEVRISSSHKQYSGVDMLGLRTRLTSETNLKYHKN